MFTLTSPDQRLQQMFPLPRRSECAETTVATHLAEIAKMLIASREAEQHRESRAPEVSTRGFPGKQSKEMDFTPPPPTVYFVSVHLAGGVKSELY